MRVYDETDVGERLGEILDLAVRDGEVRIRRRDGSTFVIRPQEITGSPLDVDGVDTDLTADEIVGFIREGRARAYGDAPEPDAS